MERTGKKAGDFNSAPFGIVGLETSAALTYTALVDKGIVTIQQIVQKMSTNPAKVIGQDDEKGYAYDISRCLHFDTCKEHGYSEFCKVFCTHDWYAYRVLKHRAKFIRKSTIAENGTVCHDTILKVK